MTSSPSFVEPGTFTPRPGAAPLNRLILAQAGMELRVLLRNGEQLLLTMVIPVLLLIGFSTTSLLDLGDGPRVDFLAPGIIALAVMSTAFTGQAIGTGFERRYGVLKRLGATPLSRLGLLGAKTMAVLAVQAIQVAMLSGVALALGWRPSGGLGAILASVVLLVLATAAFSSLALLMAGTLRAEATLAAANLVYVVLLGLGGVVFPVDRYPSAVQPVVEALPITALASGLRAVLTGGAAFPVLPALVLLVWALVGTVLATRFFQWD
ncbi:ABC transporter permease [Nocardiopsis ansamitocini]|uniref:Transport permease protein n=1 Tax=Nocardiopsis ansamitocini TaxID=1670832 RepID=A0A9W6P9J2_9ACTN|nr:ABC transporter permease [Nocardiopsis ansamitocini]GLU49463.1 transport permease protein [Nocardiopsis ansamitocini]